MRVLRYLPLLALAPLCLAAQTMKNPKTGCAPLAKLDSVALLRDIGSLADDSTRGRAIGSPEAAKVRDFLAQRFKKVGLKPLGDNWIHDVPTTGRQAGVKAANVIGMIKGSKTPDEYIVVTAHYDHLGVRAPARRDTTSTAPIDSIMNGADDNASGTAALAILAEYFVRLKPTHSIIFAAVDGEESGMSGSRGFVEQPTVPLDQILMNINLDMLSRNDKNEIYAAGSKKYPQLESLVEATSACSPVDLRLGHDNPAQMRDDWTNQSDQGSFHKKGIPFIYFGVEDHPDYHKVTDEVSRIMPGFYVGVTRTVADFISRFDAKPVARVKAPTL